MPMPSTLTATEAETLSNAEARTSRPALVPDAPPADAQIRVHCERENFHTATGVILHRYGGEVRAFLSARTRSRMSMEEVYSVFSEDVWKGLPRFRFQGQVRSWIYVVARNALSRHRKLRQRWRSRHVCAEPDELAPQARRSLIARLDFGQLEPLLHDLAESDRHLLEQRLLRSMSWLEIATEHAPASSPAELARTSARLRKRYQLLIEALRRRAAARRDSLAG